MKPIGPLMREHRLIDRMVNILAEESRLAVEGHPPDPALMVLAVDFFQTYAEHTHFGKEEGILFAKLAEKPLSPEHSRIMHELIAEHSSSRGMSSALRTASERYSLSDPGSRNDLLKPLNDLVALYPAHTEKEDKQFFFPILAYLSTEEQNAMLEQFAEFDRKMVHEIYLKAIEKAESSLRSSV